MKNWLTDFPDTDERIILLCSELMNVADTIKLDRWVKFQTESFQGSIKYNGPANEFKDVLEYFLNLYSQPKITRVQIVPESNVFYFFEPFVNGPFICVTTTIDGSKLQVEVWTGDNAKNELKERFRDNPKLLTLLKK